MKVQIEYTAVLAAKGASSGDTLDMPDGVAVTDVLDFLHVRKDHQKYVVPFVNGDKKRLTDKLRDGDKLVLSLPVGGG